MELSQCKERLDAWFSDKEPEMLSMLERIVNMDSFTTDAQDVDQLGRPVSTRQNFRKSPHRLTSSG